MSIGDIITINIDDNDELFNLLELEQIHLDAYENLFNNFIINKDMNELNQINLTDFMNKYQEQFIQTNKIKKEFSKYLMEIISELKKYEFNWNADFYTNLIVIKIIAERNV